ncbi:hypothetical protein C8R46DRAFT_832727, partial [Mycena filopes]
LGHPNEQLTRSLARSGKYDHVLKLTTAEINTQLPTCDACARGKLTRAAFPASKSRADKPLRRVYSDLWGKSKVRSRSGKSYMISFLDDH